MPYRGLLLHYSFTGQTTRAMEIAEKTLSELGWETRSCQLDFADDALTFPLEPFWPTFTDLCARAANEEAVKVVVKGHRDEDLLRTDWDLILIGSPTWARKPALPVVGFLRSPLASDLLRGRPFAAFAVCRGLWRGNVSTIRNFGESQGGEWLGGAGLAFEGSTVQSFYAFFSHHLPRGIPGLRSIMRPVTPYGPSAASLADLPTFVTRVAVLSIGLAASRKAVSGT